MTTQGPQPIPTSDPTPMETTADNTKGHAVPSGSGGAPPPLNDPAPHQNNAQNPAQEPRTGPKLRIRIPNDFDGNRSRTRKFITEIMLYLSLNSHIYDTDKKKISFILSFMNGGTAETWKQRKIIEYTNLPEWPTYRSFLNEIDTAFNTADAPGDARAKLKTL